MNFGQWIAQKIRKPSQSTFSKTVYNIGIITIATGVAVLILAYMILYGFKANVYNRLFSLSAPLQVSKYGFGQSIEEKPIKNDSIWLAKIKSTKNVATAYPTAQLTGILKANDEIHGVAVKGLDKNYNWAFFKQLIKDGGAIAYNDSSYSSQIMISSKIAKNLQLKINDEAIVYFIKNPPKARKLKVVGIFETNLEEFDNQMILADIKLIQRINNWPKDSIGGVSIDLVEINKLTESKNAIAKVLKPEHNLETVKETFLPIFDWLELLDRNMYLFLGILIFIAGFNVVSVLLILILERLGMIGLLQALGAKNYQLKNIFFFMGLRMTVMGLIWGNIIGIVICFIQKQWQIIPLDPANYFINHVPISWHWPTVILINIGALILIALILLVPALIIKTIKPIQAINFNK